MAKTTIDDSFILSRWPQELRESITPSAELLQRVARDLGLELEREVPLGPTERAEK